MRILYLIFVLSVLALLFTALAAARHIRRHEEKRKVAVEEKLASPQGSELPGSESEAEVLVAAGKSHNS